jgi:hypothetical protein
MAKKKQEKAPSEIYQLEITLLGSKPRIWRRFEVPANITLASLHYIIQTVMGWENSHLHQFTIGEERYGEIIPDVVSGMDLEMTDERKIKLGDVVGNVGDRFMYEYDFGDSWEHGLKVLKTGPPEPGVRYPVCLAGKRACPPEDCGGVWGYENLLEIIADPSHEEHGSMMEWLGEEFDPEAFDLDEINGTLRRMR